MRKILLAVPIRGRGWLMEGLIKSIEALDTSGLDVRAFFLIQGPYPGEDIQSLYLRNMLTTTKTIPDPGLEIRCGRPWRSDGSCQYAYMAYIRNLLVIEALREGRDLFSVDSDILLNPDTLQVLAKEGRAMIISALVRNHPTAQAYNVMKVEPTYGVAAKQGYIRFTRSGLGDIHGIGVIPCALTGACSLIPYSILEQIEYLYHPQGEDAGLATDVALKLLGPMYCNTDHVVAHRYTKTQTLT